MDENWWIGLTHEAAPKLLRVGAGKVPAPLIEILKAPGRFTEIIQWRTRMFVPFDPEQRAGNWAIIAKPYQCDISKGCDLAQKSLKCENRTLILTVSGFESSGRRLEILLTEFGNEKFCLECCAKLTALQAWPFSKIYVDQWLSNFDDADKAFALHMVSQFIYLNDQLVDAQFLSSFQNISNINQPDWQSFNLARITWNSFLNSCLIIPVQGENPSPADSGYIFARKARQILRIDEDQLVDLDNAITMMDSGSNLPIVFVDDFVGSGEQFTKTLERTSRIAGVFGKSIATLIASRPDQLIYYCNIAMTEKGRDRIKRDYPTVILSSGSILGSEYSWTSNHSKMWPNGYRNSGVAFVEKYTKALGYIDDGGSETDWRGFHCLGLGFAFEHSTPDANLPIFFSENNGWKPLVKRT